MFRLFAEAVFVGLLLAISLLLTLRVVQPTTNVGILAVGFALGALIHLGCEVTGINKQYCKTGYACL
jgi:hypothetical protein